MFFDDISRQFDLAVENVVKELGVKPEDLLKKVDGEYADIINEFDNNLIDFKLQHNRFSLNEFLEGHIKNQETIVSKNFESFKYFITYINCAHIICEKSFAQIDKKNSSENMKLCISLYGIIVRKSEQIVTLLIDGYVDAAMIIWRSLYENVIATITLLSENSDELAKKFRNHSLKNSKKKILSYGVNHKELKFKPLPDKVTKELEEEEQRVEELYGKDFIRNEFGWADELFSGKQKASLRLLEKRINLNKYRPYYIMCSEHIHLGFNVFNDYTEDNGVILPGILWQETELKKFVDPIQFTVSVLHEMNIRYLHKVSVQHEYDINVKFITRIFEDLLKTFPESE